MLNTRMRISVLGAGAWGTALASHAAQSHDVVLWGRDASLVAQMAATHVNATYLPGIALQAMLRFSDDLQAALDHAAGDDALAVIASPVAGLADLTRAVAEHGGVSNVIWLCKGFDPETGALPHAIVAEVLRQTGRSDLATGVLSGPSFAKEVAQGLPCAMTVASTNDTLCGFTQRGFHHHAMRVYASDDLVGVEVGGAVKNVLAIATGAADGLGLGLNARAALVTRGLAEMTRLGLALGGRPETFMGLTGMGDLLLTATGDLSRNRTVGMQLAQGRTLDDILHSLGHVAEGVRCARAVAALARDRGVDMPITFTVCEVLFEGLAPARAVERLLQRDAKSESAR
ncbi:Glycerol-3-phosphate dehydrogenase [NAD(P)+] [Ralstonia mannitolilytica]|uniref:Glycerol-3-phosphate dehydrogenase [NAD(P)+] n=2 Tax=Ralstonia mannitolilytica TaxID=105219 RepID=A0AAJ4ZIT0_9RALS|nr:NAD(P)H-dependent glycerol-3-phosphate dehydrogenase [Ralstonia mannitolilytica]CAG2152186.1 Glycerol-3-phosphate dehydrogenase [NAD(P)+] [Ralstonia mannitolilytica]CAJ0736415.1 Glycerol-3-phosphate dehydrogenase [NAD(P)+] [Ralstonia mannitolilytica]SUD86639.1 Glycerol-3-phosphate dehydrogenase [NAD(P)+] [Ralstonia mannitolilytica]SUD92577.1 Glycerol-3-phosphate dehydrogenase [NAD(P)+] [Ralstonia mannitolilytica]SUD96300.1 Glycerol-3-phosphate dehydrogenase [NAD(P)+] [Ralstonia mannitolilyt